MRCGRGGLTAYPSAVHRAQPGTGCGSGLATSAFGRQGLAGQNLKPFDKSGIPERPSCPCVLFDQLPLIPILTGKIPSLIGNPVQHGPTLTS